MAMTKAQHNAEIKALKARLGMTTHRSGYYGIEESKKNGGVRISTLTGKLEGFHSLSTSPECAEFCERMSKVKGSICEKCFSRRSVIPEEGGYKAGLRDALVHNHHWMNQYHEIAEFPQINDLYSRLQSHAETDTVEQAINFIKYCLRNPDTHFTGWCKNAKVWDAAIAIMGKPENLQMVYSAPMINREVKWEKIHAVYWWVDKVFTVYSPEYILEHPEIEATINCGSRQCMSCLICYRKNDIRQIRELLK